jgi:hypothetical protein
VRRGRVMVAVGGWFEMEEVRLRLKCVDRIESNRR